MLLIHFCLVTEKIRGKVFKESVTKSEIEGQMFWFKEVIMFI